MSRDPVNEHVDEDLGRLLRGEASRPELLRAAGHLRSCDDCRDALISALVAHTSLTSAAEYLSRASGRRLELRPISLPGGRSVSDAPSEKAPPEPASDAPSEEAPEPVTDAAPEAHRDPGTASRRNEPAHRAERAVDAPRRRRSARWLVAAAVAAVTVAAGSALLVQRAGSDHGATVALEPYGNGTTVSGSARVTGGDEITLDASRLPAPAAGTLYEVWLTNSGRTTMYPIGSLPADRRGAFTVAANLVRTYTAIEVSVQAVNTSAYSGLSLLRGDYG